jgi:hypothetical protein
LSWGSNILGIIYLPLVNTELVSETEPY